MRTLSFAVLSLFVALGSAHAGRPAAAGVWVYKGPPELMLLLQPDGSYELNGSMGKWSATRSALKLAAPSGTVTYRMNVRGNRMHLSGGDLPKPVTFVRGGSESPGETAPPDPPRARNRRVQDDPRDPPQAQDRGGDPDPEPVRGDIEPGRVKAFHPRFHLSAHKVTLGRVTVRMPSRWKVAATQRKSGAEITSMNLGYRQGDIENHKIVFIKGADARRRRAQELRRARTRWTATHGQALPWLHSDEPAGSQGAGRHDRAL